jgi:pimeloyl-ACP methyl ester carboxylesterase
MQPNGAGRPHPSRTHVTARVRHHVEPKGAVSLADGRSLSYVEFGDPEGYPVLNCHGAFTGGLDVAVASEIARRLGVRIVSPDRPGTGASTRARGRTIAEWPADVEELLDALEIERCSVLGWSLGGPYAASLAALLPQRVDAVAIVAGIVPLDWPWEQSGAARSLLTPNLHLSDKWPGYASLRFRLEAELALRSRRRWWAIRSRSMLPADVAAVEVSGVGSLSRALSQGLRRPGGTVDDFRAVDQPWGFAYESITVPVRLWHGVDDPLVPCGWSHEAMKRIRGSVLFAVEGAGHFVAWSRFEAVLRDLLASGADRRSGAPRSR